MTRFLVLLRLVGGLCGLAAGAIWVFEGRPFWGAVAVVGGASMLVIGWRTSRDPTYSSRRWP